MDNTVTAAQWMPAITNVAGPAVSETDPFVGRADILHRLHYMQFRCVISAQNPNYRLNALHSNPIYVWRRGDRARALTAYISCH